VTESHQLNFKKVTSSTKMEVTISTV